MLINPYIGRLLASYLDHSSQSYLSIKRFFTLHLVSFIAPSFCFTLPILVFKYESSKLFYLNTYRDCKIKPGSHFSMARSYKEIFLQLFQEFWLVEHIWVGNLIAENMRSFNFCCKSSLLVWALGQGFWKNNFYDKVGKETKLLGLLLAFPKNKND